MASMRQWELDRPVPLLLQTGFVEGARVKILGDPKWQEFLYAPALYYPHAGTTYALPYRWQHNNRAYTEELFRRVEGQRFAAVVSAAANGKPLIIDRLSALHGRPRLPAHLRHLDVYAFGPP